VAEHLHLRRPGPDDEPLVLRPFQESFGEERVEVWLRARERVAKILLLAARAPHDPEEPLPRLLQADGDLLELLLGERAPAPEGEEHDAAVRLRVQPLEALVLVAPAPRDQRPDTVDRWCRAAGDAHPRP